MRAPVAATMPNMTMPAPPSTTTGTASTRADIFGTQAERHHNETAGRRDPARAHAGNAYETDILRKRRVGERVENAAEDRAGAIRTQSARDRCLVDPASGHLAEREKHACQFDHHHDHHDAHGDDRNQLKFR